MRYESPETVDQAVELLNKCDGITRVLAGGTDILVQLRLAMVEPELVVDIKKKSQVCAILSSKTAGMLLVLRSPVRNLASMRD